MADDSAQRGSPTSKTIIGWREFVALPEWGVTRIRAKADTGAKTSAIDVDNLEVLPNDRVRFDLVWDRKHPERRTHVETAIVRHARVKSSVGTLHTRPVVETRIRFGPVEKTIQLGLVCRKRMTCRMLLGRAALAPDVVVDSSHRYLLGRPRGRRSSS